MNDLLLDPVRHNQWATGRLLAFCRDLRLTEAQLAVCSAGTYGGILATLGHVVSTDASYLHALLGRAPSWAREGSPTDVAGLAARAEESARLWEEWLAGPIDVERVIVVDEGTREVRAGIFLAQALNHSNHHRAQVCWMLKGLGVQPPDLQAWEYGWASGRLWDRKPS